MTVKARGSALGPRASAVAAASRVAMMPMESPPICARPARSSVPVTTVVVAVVNSSQVTSADPTTRHTYPATAPSGTQNATVRHRTSPNMTSHAHAGAPRCSRKRTSAFALGVCFGAASGILAAGPVSGDMAIACHGCGASLAWWPHTYFRQTHQSRQLFPTGIRTRLHRGLSWQVTTRGVLAVGLTTRLAFICRYSQLTGWALALNSK